MSAKREPTEGDEQSRRFVELRPLLFTIAYEILGSAADADDVLQESYLRWARVDPATVADARAYLAKTVTRQALNALRSAVRRRETYVGPWLPEPILLDEHDAADDVVLAESVSTAMLVVLESLSPDERAVFVLYEVFGFTHDEIADMVGKSGPAVRQIAHRAREHVRARRRRFDPVDSDRASSVTEKFMAATQSGSVDQLLAVLAPNVVYTADSGGKVSAARRPVQGATAVSRLLAGLARIGARMDDFRLEPAAFNNMPGLRLHADGILQGVVVLDIAAGSIENVYLMRNPEKLGGVAQPRTLAR